MHFLLHFFFLFLVVWFCLSGVHVVVLVVLFFVWVSSFTRLNWVVFVYKNVSSMVVFAAFFVFCMFIFGGLIMPLCGSSCVLAVLVFFWSVCFLFNNAAVGLYLVVIFCDNVSSLVVLCLFVFLQCYSVFFVCVFFLTTLQWICVWSLFFLIMLVVFGWVCCFGCVFYVYYWWFGFSSLWLQLLLYKYYCVLCVYFLF